jgi:hypothetical protein
MDFTLTDSDEEDDGVAEGDRGRLRKESRMERLSFQVRPWPRLPRFPVTPAASFHCRAVLQLRRPRGLEHHHVSDTVRLV